MRNSFYTEANVDFEGREQLGLKARPHTPPPVFLRKSSYLLDGKGVEFSENDKEFVSD